MWLLLLLLVLIALVGQSSAASARAFAPPTVQTTSGIIKGLQQLDVRQYLAIPYAQPPVGELRWLPPQELMTPRRRLEANRLPPSCPQGLTSLDNSLAKNDVLEFNLQGLNTTGATDEDCLTLSIWAPANPKSKSLPVFLYIYGGGWYQGGQDVPYQIPFQWVQRTQEHIVVVPNHRLNIFGWPNAEGLQQQNLGILDQRLAIEWTSKNIAAFGGDPTRITLFGHSSGGMSIDNYNYAYHQKPLISGMILQSGTATIPLYSSDFSQLNFTAVAAYFGCTDQNSRKRLACFRKVPEKAISEYIQKDLDNGQPTGLVFAPIPDERIIFANHSAQAAKLSRIPAIIGNAAQEGVSFEPYPVTDPNAGVNQTNADLVALTYFTCPTEQTIRIRHSANLATFRYKYSGNFSNISPRSWEGAYHSSELPLVFGTYDNYRGKGPLLEHDTSIAIQDAWLAFGRDGVKGLQRIGWQPYSLLARNTREFGADVPAKNIAFEDAQAQCAL